jgi:hypothetical protein
MSYELQKVREPVKPQFLCDRVMDELPDGYQCSRESSQHQESGVIGKHPCALSPFILGLDISKYDTLAKVFMHIYLYILSAFLQYLADSLFITLVDKSVD